eukprot:1141087-Pelagomonas_calceolata.AAC.17
MSLRYHVFCFLRDQFHLLFKRGSRCTCSKRARIQVQSKREKAAGTVQVEEQVRLQQESNCMLKTPMDFCMLILLAVFSCSCNQGRSIEQLGSTVPLCSHAAKLTAQGGGCQQARQLAWPQYCATDGGWKYDAISTSSCPADCCLHCVGGVLRLLASMMCVFGVRIKHGCMHTPS